MLKILISVSILQVTSATIKATRPKPSCVAQDSYDNNTLIWFLQKSSTLSGKAVKIISASWRQDTEKRYHKQLCHKQQTDLLSATTETGIEFLTEYLNIVVS